MQGGRTPSPRSLWVAAFSARPQAQNGGKSLLFKPTCEANSETETDAVRPPVCVRDTRNRKDHFVLSPVSTGLGSLRGSQPHRNASQQILAEPVRAQPPDVCDDARQAGPPESVRGLGRQGPAVRHQMLGHPDDGFWIIARSKEVYLHCRMVFTLTSPAGHPEPVHGLADEEWLTEHEAGSVLGRA